MIKKHEKQTKRRLKKKQNLLPVGGQGKELSFLCVFYFFISNLSLCDILYIILSCIQTISSNYKG